MSISRNVHVALTVIFACVASVQLVSAIRGGHQLGAPLLLILLGPGFALLVWGAMQEAQPRNFTLGNISYAAVLGDLLVLPAVVALAALGWSKLDRSSLHTFWTSPGWLFVSLFIGLALGAGFHLMGGPSDSFSDNEEYRLHDAPMAWAHDIGIFGFIAAALICTILPLLFTTGTSRTLGLVALGMIVVLWGGLSALDMWRAGLPAGHPFRVDLNRWTNIDTNGFWPWRGGRTKS